MSTSQYAYEGSRGIGCHKMGLFRTSQKALSSNRLVYISILGVTGAVDTVLHDKLLLALRERGIER